MRKLKQLSVLLAVTLLMNVISVYAYTENGISDTGGLSNDSNVTADKRVEVRSPKNASDKKFPVDFWLSIPESQAVLDDNEALPTSVKLNIELKDSYMNASCVFEYFSLKPSIDSINNGAKNITIIRNRVVDDKSMCEINIVPLHCYSFAFDCSNGTDQATFMGLLSVGYDWDGTLCLSVSYNRYSDNDINTMEDPSAIVEETESNGNRAYANEMTLGAYAVGTIEEYDDDCFKFSTEAMPSGTIKIRLESTDPTYTTNLDVYIWNSSGMIIDYSCNEQTCNEYIELSFSESSNSVYYISVEHTAFLGSVSYRISTEFEPSVAWYTQMTSYARKQIGSIEYNYYTWNSLNMDKLYFPNSTFMPEIPFMGPLDGDKKKVSYRMEEGCAIASAAMVLKNLGSTFYGFDIRTNTYRNMDADPYTVTLANVKPTQQATPAIVYDSDTDRWNVPSVTIDPIAITFNMERLAENFQLTAQKITLSGTVSEKAQIIDTRLSYHPQGIIIKFPGHFMVINGINPDYESGDDINYKYLVCDPGTSRTDAGYNLPLNACYSSSSCTIANAIAIYYISV